MTYAFDRNGSVVEQLADQALRIIPPDPANADYQRILAWQAEGNTIAPYVPSIVELQARVSEIREQKIAAGVTFNAVRYDSDQRSRENLSGTVAAIAAGVPLPAGFAWRSAGNVDVPMTAADVVNLGAAMMQHVNACYANSWALKAQLAAATDPAAVDLDAGWPS